MTDVRFFEIDEYIDSNEIPSFLIAEMLKERKRGHLVFVCSKYPYYVVHKKFYKYANGFLTNDNCYAQMGCCEVLFSNEMNEKEIGDLQKKLHPFASLILHGVKDDFKFYSNKNSVYSCTISLKDEMDYSLVEKLVSEEYKLESSENCLEYLLIRKDSLKEKAKETITKYFKGND